LAANGLVFRLVQNRLAKFACLLDDRGFSYCFHNVFGRMLRGSAPIQHTGSRSANVVFELRREQISMAEMPRAGEHHRDVSFVCRSDHVAVAN
jgi:hypothetical protein